LFLTSSELEPTIFLG